MKKFSLILLIAAAQAVKIVKSEEDENTDQWARADKIQSHRAKTLEMEIHTGGMSLDQKSNLLHSIANGAQSDIDEEEHPTEKPLTSEQIVNEREKTAE